MKWGLNLFVVFQLGFLTASGSFLIYNTVLPLYKRLRNEVQKRVSNNFLIDNRKLIISTPGGLHGFYLMGVSSYIKEHYDLSDCIFSGASAGAWNSLFLCFKGKTSEFIDCVLSPEIYNAKSLNELERIMSNNVYQKYKNKPEIFSLHRMSIGVTLYTFPWKFRLRIYDDFKNLADAIECCVASSHIPFITGSLIFKYRDLVSFDGGFFNYPYINTTTPTLVITANMWESNFTKSNSYQNPLKYSKNNVDFYRLYKEGYKDTQNNKDKLDKLLKLRDNSKE